MLIRLSKKLVFLFRAKMFSEIKRKQAIYFVSQKETKRKETILVSLHFASKGTMGTLTFIMHTEKAQKR